MANLDLTCGGRLTVSPFVNQRKVEAMADMVAAAKMGGYAGERARTDLKETLTTSDGPHSFTHLVNLRNLPQYDEVQPEFAPIVQEETVPDFDPIQIFPSSSLSNELTDMKSNPRSLPYTFCFFALRSYTGIADIANLT